LTRLLPDRSGGAAQAIRRAAATESSPRSVAGTGRPKWNPCSWVQG
jgi:hypothetical protein